MHSLFSRLVLWLIRPALERRAAESIDLQAAVVQIVVDDLRKNGPLARALRRTVSLDCSVTLLNRDGWSATAHARPVPWPAAPAKPGDKAQIGPLDV